MIINVSLCFFNLKSPFATTLNFEDLYHEFKNMVYNLALQYVQHAEDAEEITQDVFVAVANSLDKFRNEAKPSTWIYRITINKSLDFIKAKRRHKRFALFTSLLYRETNIEVNQSAHFDHPGVKLEQKESLRELFSAINQLPDQQKTALILQKIERKSQIETAEIMNISAKAVESLVQRAKTNLLKKINSKLEG